MAKKAKTPRPPVRAPKRRDERSAGLGLRSVPRWGIVVAVVVLAGIAAAIALALSGGGGTESADAKVSSAMQAAGCTLRAVPPLPPKGSKTNYHADSPTLTSKTKWSTFPPSGGGHYPAWAVWGFYRAPVNPRQIVHNLEHGGVAIWWGPKVSSGTVDQLETFYRESPESLIGTPIAGLGKKIALTAWTGDPKTYYRDGDYGMGHIATCTSFDEDAFVAFRDAYRGKGPEGVPSSSNMPGSGPGA